MARLARKTKIKLLDEIACFSLSFNFTSLKRAVHFVSELFTHRPGKVICTLYVDATHDADFKSF